MSNSDTSDYPKNHTFFSFSLDPDLPPHLLQVVERISAAAPRSIRETTEKLLSSLAKAEDANTHLGYISQEIQMDDDYYESGDDYDPYDEFEDLVPVSSRNKEALQFPRLQRCVFPVNETILLLNQTDI
jgi:ubiquitin-conjugating enzyme E2 Q